MQCQKLFDKQIKVVRVLLPVNLSTQKITYLKCSHFLRPNFLDFLLSLACRAKSASSSSSELIILFRFSFFYLFLFLSFFDLILRIQSSLLLLSTQTLCDFLLFCKSSSYFTNSQQFLLSLFDLTFSTAFSLRYWLSNLILIFGVTF